MQSIRGLSWIQQKQPVEFDGFYGYMYMLYSLGYTVEYWIRYNQAKPGGGFWWISGVVTCTCRVQTEWLGSGNGDMET